MKPHPVFLGAFCFAGEGRELPPSSNPRLPSGPELANQNGAAGLCREKGRRQTRNAAALPLASPLLLAALGLAGDGGGRMSPARCYWADSGIFWGGRREGAQRWFCGAGFQLASAGTRRQRQGGQR